MGKIQVLPAGEMETKRAPRHAQLQSAAGRHGHPQRAAAQPVLDGPPEFLRIYRRERERLCVWESGGVE